MADKIDKSISVLFPVYNEKNLVTVSVEHCLSVLSENFNDFEIIIINDGSTDGVGPTLDLLAKKDPRIKVLENYVNLNIGVALQRGLMFASCDYVVQNGVDLPLAPEDIAGLVRKMEDCDILVLERSSYAGYMRWRIVTSLLNRFLIHLLFPLVLKGIFDSNFTQIYTTNIIPKIIPDAKSPAFTTPELLILAKFLNYKINTTLVDYKPRVSGKGALGKPHDIFWSLYDLVRFRFKLWGNKAKTLHLK